MWLCSFMASLFGEKPRKAKALRRDSYTIAKTTMKIPKQSEDTVFFLLPEEIVLYMLGFLSPKDLGAVAQACKYWSTLSCDPSIWRTMWLHAFARGWLDNLANAFPLHQHSWKQMFKHTAKFEFGGNVDGDHSGVMYWIGCAAGTDEYIQPTRREDGIVVMASGVNGTGRIEDFVLRHDRARRQCWSENKPGSWYAVDLGPKRRLIPSSYTLRYGSSGDYCYPTDWVLLGANDNDDQFLHPPAHLPAGFGGAEDLPLIDLESLPSKERKKEKKRLQQLEELRKKQRKKEKAKEKKLAKELIKMRIREKDRNDKIEREIDRRGRGRENRAKKDIDNDRLLAENLNWKVLRVHSADHSLKGSFAAKNWEIPGCSEPFRYFRVLQMGTNSSSPAIADLWAHVLVLSGFELYGLLITRD